jgi:uncharacterized protein
MDYGEESVRVGLSRHGLGVFSQRSFRAYERIGPIQGAIITDPDYQSDYCMELGQDRSLEPDSPFRFLNHSCHPNCELVEFEGDGDSELWVEVQAAIGPDDELTIDYCWPATSAVPCTCGCLDCRGWIVAPDELEQIEARRQGQPPSAAGLACHDSTVRSA